MTASQSAAESASRETAALVRRLVVPRLLRAATDRGWFSPLEASTRQAREAAPSGGVPSTLTRPDLATVERLAFAPRLVAGLDSPSLASLLGAAVADAADPLDVTLAVDGDVVVGLAASARLVPGRPDGPAELLALGVSPVARRRGLATTLLERHVAAVPAGEWRATVTLAERDPVEPLDRSDRAAIARRLLEGAGFEVSRAAGDAGRADPLAIDAVRRRFSRPGQA